MLTLNLPQFDHKLTKKEGKLFIWDMIRGKYVRLTPEEWVRQHFIHYLVNEKQISPKVISLEYVQKYNTLLKRCDILVWGADTKPLLLVECKAGHVALKDDNLLQAGSYNAGLDVPYITITNGIAHHYFEREGEGYRKIGELPEINIT